MGRKCYWGDRSESHQSGTFEGVVRFWGRSLGGWRGGRGF